MQYPAKILLFGEYTILLGSAALAIPFSGFWAEWAYGPTTEQDALSAFAEYLSRHFSDEEIDVTALQSELENGLYLSSNMPRGYGIGSSGAVCAAVLDRFGRKEAKEKKDSELRSFFARMESFFHGSSSGIDPLVCYLQRGLYLQGDGAFEAIQPPSLEEYQLFLLDTGEARETGPLVAFFKEKWEESAFREGGEKTWIPATEQAIEHYLSGSEPKLWEAFSVLSRYQLSALPPMIPESIVHIWKAGLAGDVYRLKICGAGGGGFMLGIAQKNVDLSCLFTKHQTIQI